MRIGIDVRTLMDQKYSGIPEYSFCVLSELLKLDKMNEYVLYYNSFRDIGEKMAVFEGGKVRIAKTGYPNKIYNYFLQKALGGPKIDRLLDVDVFFMPHFNFASFSGRAKTVITVHDVSFLVYPEFFSWRKNVWHKALDVRNLLLGYDHIVAISENTKQDLIEFCQIDPRKITTVHSGIAKEFKAMPKDDPQLRAVKERYGLPDKFILYLGTIEPRKNVDGLILAFGRLLAENPDLKDLHLVIAGAKGWKYEKTIEVFEKSACKEKIVFTGYVDRQDKAAIYNLAEIFVYPSFYEGFGFPPLEAMACGVPCVASANSSLSEILDNAALFVDPYNIDMIKAAMGELLNDGKMRERQIERGFRVVEKYDWQKTAENMLDIFQNLGKGH